MKKVTYSQINPGETTPIVLFEVRKQSTTISINPPVSIQIIDSSTSTSQASQKHSLVASYVDDEANHRYAIASVACLLEPVPSTSNHSDYKIDEMT